MSIRGALALSLVVAFAATSVPTAAQSNGLLSGTAQNEAKTPYSNYRVDLRDLTSLQIVATSPLDQQAKFSLANLALGKKYQVELVRFMEQGHPIPAKIICQEGPYTLSTTMLSKTDIDINCGSNAAALAMAIAGGGVAVAALGVRSPSK